MIKKTELLAPAGNYDAFLAAVENGADAIYLGGKLLNARQSAGNFDDVELERALDYAHARGVNIYLTMNTLVLDNEMQEAVEYAGKAYEMGIDSLIVQDLGLAANLRKVYPELHLHASTQMTTYNYEGVKALEDLGFSRVVLARELALNEIEDICVKAKTEIEVFVHGALCISYSGQCLMSSLIGGRSGNRGKCAQPCRLPYSIQREGNRKKEGYLLSPKDICFIDNLEDMVRAGVSSLKIEGRMKSPEYVANVVSTYRKYLDRIEEKTESSVSTEDKHRLMQSFNRGGFSKGYLLGKTGPDMMCYEKPKNWGTYLGTILDQDKNILSVKIRLENTLGNGDGIEIWSRPNQESPGGIITKIMVEGHQVKKAKPGDVVWASVIKGTVENGSKVYKTSDKELNESAARSFASSNRKANITGEFVLRRGIAPNLTLKDSEGISVCIQSEIMPEEAVNKPLTKKRISDQLCKMGSTPFNITKLDITLDEGMVVPVSELNNIRRLAAEQLEQKRITARKHKISSHLQQGISFENQDSRNTGRTNDKVKLSAMFYGISKDIALEKVDVDRFYIPFASIVTSLNSGSSIAKEIDDLREKGKEIFAYIPSVIKGKYTTYIINNFDKVRAKVDGILIGNMGVLQLLKDRFDLCNIEIMGDHSMNVMNGSSLQFVRNQGFTGTMLSYELNQAQISSVTIPDNFEVELGIYGRIPVMTSEYCPIGSAVGSNTPHNCKSICKTGEHTLKDRKGAEFPVLGDNIDCRSTIFNSNIIFIPDIIRKLCDGGISYMRLNFVDEKPQEIYDIVNLHRSIVENNEGGQDNDRVMKTLKNKDYTKGHYQRGV